MTTDDFTTAARAEAKDRWWNGAVPRDINPNQAWILGFQEGAPWARTYLAEQEPTDAEIEAALTALLISESIALGQTADEAADYAIRELETRDLTNLRTGVRCSLRAARAARRDEEKR